MWKFIKSTGGWVVSFLLSVWAGVKFVLDWVGRTTIPEDWDALMHEKLPSIVSWLFSTPWWVPAIFAGALTGWMMWITWPRKGLTDSPSGEAALIEAQAELAKQNRLADKLNRPVIEPLPVQKPPAQGGDFLTATATISDPPPFNADHVYVGQVLMEIDKVASERVIFFLFRCFNGSGNGINIKNPKGRVRFGQSIDGSGIDLGDMPAAPFYVDGIKTENVKPGNEFDLRLEQRVTKDMADRLAEFPIGTSFSFDFEELDIPLQSVRWQNIGRLKLWDGAMIFRKADHIHIGKIVAVKGTATAKTRVR